MDKFGYKFYDLIGKKVIQSKDVVFVEDQTLRDVNKAKYQWSSLVMMSI